MKIRTVTTIAVVCGLLMPLTFSLAAAKVVKGTVAVSPAGAASVLVRVDGKVISIKRGKNALITRGPTGEKGRAVPLREFLAGDTIVATVTNGEATSMKAYYAVPAKPKPSLRINSVTFSAPVPLRPGDVITVDLTGTPRANAAFGVKDFIAVVKMWEMSPGAYHGTVKVPKGRIARNAPLVGYLGYGGAHAAPVQASRLVTVFDTTEQRPRPAVPPLRMSKPGPMPVTEPDRLPAVKPENPPSKPVRHAPAPDRKPAHVSRNIVLTSPVDGGVVRSAIVVSGAADPDTVVKVEITYSNGLTGVLKLAGEVASQNLSCGRNGEFRMAPIALDGPLATDGLKFTIKAYYPDRAAHGAAEVSVTGKRD